MKIEKIAAHVCWMDIFLSSKGRHNPSAPAIRDGNGTSYRSNAKFSGKKSLAAFLSLPE